LSAFAHLGFSTKRFADLDNFNKLSLDALTGDSQIARLTILREYDKAKPRIEINVAPFAALGAVNTIAD
jgi:Holliday junction resolvase RusA-like endonuclease